MFEYVKEDLEAGWTKEKGADHLENWVQREVWESLLASSEEGKNANASCLDVLGGKDGCDAGFYKWRKGKCGFHGPPARISNIPGIDAAGGVPRGPNPTLFTPFRISARIIDAAKYIFIICSDPFGKAVFSSAEE